MRSIYATHVHMNCLTRANLDPCKFEFERNDADAWYPSDSKGCNVAHAESGPQSDARAGRLWFRVVYFARVILDSDTHLIEIHIE